MKIEAPFTKLDDNVITPFMFGGTTDGTDQTAVFQRMAATSATVWHIPANTSWRIDSVVSVTHDLTVIGTGTLDFSQGIGQLIVEGSITTLSSLSTNITKHSRTLSWGSSQGLVAGDVVIIWNPTDFSWGSRREEYRDGAMFRVHSVISNDVKTYDLAVDSYDKDDFNVYKVNPVKVTIEDIIVIPSNVTSRAPIKVLYGVDVKLRGIKSTPGGTYGGIQIDRCYNVSIESLMPVNNSPHVDDEYGIIISNSQHVSVTGAGAFGTRHGVTIGGTGATASVPNRFISITNMSIWNAPASSLGSADAHGNSDFVTYSNCFMTGFTGGGRNIRIHGCTIFGMPETTSQFCVSLPEIVGGYIEFIDCTFISEGDGSTNNHGYIHASPFGPSGGGSPAGTNMREDVSLRLLNCRFITPNANEFAKIVFINAENANKKVNVEMNGVMWDGATDGLAFLYMRDNVLTDLLGDYIIVNNVKGPDGVYLCFPHTTINTIPKRLMEQRVTIDIECTSGGSAAISSSLNFRHPYPKIPECHAVSIGSTDGSAKSTWGGRPLSSYSYARTTLTARIGASPIGGNFNSTENVRLIGTFGINEI